MTQKHEKFEITDKFLILSVIGVIFGGLFLRLYFFPFELPITQDSFLYFFYAIDTMLLGDLPKPYTFPNNGWPLFLSLIFSLFDFDSAMGFMTIQRFTSMKFC